MLTAHKKTLFVSQRLDIFQNDIMNNKGKLFFKKAQSSYMASFQFSILRKKEKKVDQRMLWYNECKMLCVNTKKKK